MHSDEKAVLSLKENEWKRENGRQMWRDMAVTQPLWKDILEHEEEVSGK